MMAHIYPKGIRFYRPHPNAPEFIRGSLSINVKEFIKFLKEYEKDGWVNIDLKKSMIGNYYLLLSEWEKEAETETKTKAEDPKIVKDKTLF